MSWYSIPASCESYDSGLIIASVVTNGELLRIKARHKNSSEMEEIVCHCEDDLIDWAIRYGCDYKILGVYDETGVYFNILDSSSDLSIEDLIEYYTK